MPRKAIVDSPVHELLSRISSQVDLLPRLRDGLAEIVEQLDEVLGSTELPRPRVTVEQWDAEKAPRSIFTKRAERTKRTKTKRGAAGGKFQPAAIFIDEMPDDAVKIPGIHRKYLFAPGKGMLSMTSSGKIRLLRLPPNKTWGVRKKNGERFALTLLRLRKKLPDVNTDLQPTEG